MDMQPSPSSLDNPFLAAPDTYAPSPGPPHYSWDYVLKGDQVTVEFISPISGEVVSYTGSVVDIDFERFYIRMTSSSIFPGGSNAYFNARQVGVRLVAHLIYYGGAAYQVTDPDAPHHPWSNRRRLRPEGNPFIGLSPFASPSPDTDPVLWQQAQAINNPFLA